MPMNGQLFSLIGSYPGGFFLLQIGVNGEYVHAKKKKLRYVDLGMIYYEK